jgi:5'-3' exonuclease
VTVLLIDGSNLAVRAHCAVKDLQDDDGNPVNAIYGSLRALRSIIAENPEAAHVIAFFDTHRSAFRKQIYPEYKQHREKTSSFDRESYYAQTPHIHSLFRCFVPVVTSTINEADDMIAWAQHELNSHRIRVRICSSDKDMFPLVNEITDIWDFHKKEKKAKDFCVNSANFQGITGLTPSQYMTFRILTGDRSDNIKGVPGVGEVTGKKLAKAYPTIAAMFEAGEEKVTGHLDVTTRNRALMVLNRHILAPHEFAEYQGILKKPHQPDHNTAKEALEYLRFRTITDDFMEWSQPFCRLSPKPIIEPDEIPL